MNDITPSRPGYRIGLVVPNLNGGGAERVMVIIANALARAGYDVGLIAGQLEGPYRALIDSRVHAYDLKSPSMMAALPRLVAHLRTHRPDALVASQDWVNVVSMLAVALARIPTRVVLREATHPGVAMVHDRSFRRRVLTWLMKRSYNRAVAVVAVSDEVRMYVASHLGVDPARVHVIYGPHFDDTSARAASEPLDHAWFRAGEPPVIISAGRLLVPKGFSTLIRAFASVRRVRPVRLMILGEGQDRRTLEDLVGRLDLGADVALPGFVVNPLAYFSHASLFVLASHWEGMPGVLAQAMTCGCPVVSTDCKSGPREILDGGRFGRLVPVGDEEELATAILETLDAPIDAGILRSRAQLFSADVGVRGFLRLLDPQGIA